MAGFALVVLLAIAGVDPSEADAAHADWVALGKGNYAYATVSTERSEPAKERAARQLAFNCASMSSNSYLGDQLPVKLPGTDLYRLDLDGLGWAKTWATVLVRHYKYRPDLTTYGRYPLVVQAQFINAELTDPIKTPGAASLLLYGRELKTAQEFRNHWKVNVTKTEAFGFIEGASGVQAEGLQRLMVNYDTSLRTRFFETFDSKIVAGKNDPLENPVLGTLKFDGSELIAGMPKHYNGQGGSLQAYFLADAKGNAVNVAPVDLVKDSEGVRGPDIRNHLDCIVCHTSGMQMPTVNAYREYLIGGAKIYADKHTKRELERLYESPFVKELDRQNEDYAAAVKLVNGLTPEKNAAEFVACIKAYDAPVTLAQAAREVYSTPEELRLAIGGYAPTLKLTARLSMLAEGQPISRDQWKLNVGQVVLEILPAWRKK